MGEYHGGSEAGCGGDGCCGTLDGTVSGPAIDCFAHGLAHLVRELGPADALACAARVILQLSATSGGPAAPTGGIDGFRPRAASDGFRPRAASSVACRRQGK